MKHFTMFKETDKSKFDTLGHMMDPVGSPIHQPAAGTWLLTTSPGFPEGDIPSNWVQMYYNL